MKLDLKTIKSISVSALEVTECEDGIHFSRFTKKQLAAWDVLREGVGERSRYSSGVHLDFHTNSKKLRFLAATCTMYDVCINGLLRASVNMHEQRKLGAPAEIELCDPLGHELDDVRVTIYFPRGNFPVVLSTLELDDGAYVKPHEFDYKFLFLGDSITAGCNAEHHSFCYSYAISNFFNAESLNQSVGGGVCDISCLDEMDFAPDTVIIAMGTNDYNHFTTAEDMESHVRDYISEVKARFSATAKRFIVISPIWRADLDFDRPMGTFEQARDIVIRAAKDNGMIHVDGLTLVPPAREFYQDEYLHPNDIGFALYTQNLLKQIIKYF